MAARRSPGNAKPITGPVLIASVAAAGYGIYSGYPGLAAIWLGLLVAAWSYPPAVFSGKKDSRGYATAGGPGETAAMNRYRFWDDLKFKLIIPTGDWLPGFKPLLSWMWAVWSGALAFFLPVSDPYTAGYGAWINAAAAYIVVAQLTASRRRNMVEGDENPGARVDALWTMTVENPAKTIGLTIGGLVVGGVLGTVATVMVPIGMGLAGLPTIPEPVLWSLFLTGGPLALLAKPWITAALEHWRIVVAAREEWDQRWMMLKQDPAPRLVDRREVGTAIIDTFDAPGSVGAMAYWAMGPKIGPTLGGGAKFAVLSTPDLDSQKQPMPGTRNPLRFDIVRWPADQLPDVTDPSTPKEVVHEFVRCALVWAADEAGGYGRPLLDEVHLLTVPPAPQEKKATDPTEEAEDVPAEPAPASAAWAATWFLPDGPPADTVRSVLRGGIQGSLNTEVLVDHRYGNGAGCMYFGDLSADAPWQPGQTNATTMENLRDEDVWNARWIEIMKMGSNPPVVQAPTARSASLANGVSVSTIAFVTRQGMTPNEFFNFEHKLKTAMNASPFVAITGYPGEGRRPGERHPQAFQVYWSSKAVPSRPDELAPVPRSDAPKWILAGLLNDGFKAARLADRPELVSATCLTKPDSRAHIWRIDLRLYGGVTLAEVRGAAQKIRQSWGSEWLRVTAAKDGCTIVVGAKPSRVKLANPRYEQELAALDWDQAFQDSGISGVGGLMPVLTKVDHLPHNKQVSVLDFDLPAGLDFTSFTGARAKLESASGNYFVEPRRIKDKSNQIQLLVCEVNPMPEKADYDWDHIEASRFIPFATGIDGEPIEYNFRVDPHLLVAGASGGGKSVLLQSLAFGALMRGYELYVADPTKGGADFKFAEPYAQAFTATPFEAAAMMRKIYAEVVRRKNLNSAHGVGKYSDLPEDIRPKHICILLDEFTSLMGQDPVPPASDDPELDAEREMIIAVNRAKTDVGVFAGKIAREARSAGVTLFLATQKLSAKMLDTIPGAGDLKVNLSRLLLGKATYGDKQSALRAPQDAPELGNAVPPGRGLFETTAGAAMVIQSWYNPDEQRILAVKLAEHLTPLDESDKADLSPFMPKMPTPYGVEEEPVVAEPEITDLGDMEFTLEELEFDLEIDEEATGDAPVPVDALEPAVDPLLEPVEFSAALPYASDTLLLLDVDGSLLPFRHTPDMTQISIPGSGAQAYRSDVVSRLSSLPVRQMWLTSRSDAEGSLGHLFPSVERSLSVDTDETGWWKIDAVVALLEQDPSIRRVIWIDDELSEPDPLLGIPLTEVAREAFRNVESLLVVPDSFNGVTGVELGLIDRFLAGEAAEELHAPPAPVLLPEPSEPLVPAAVPAAVAAVVDPFDVPAPRKAPTAKKARVADDPFDVPVKPFRGPLVTQPDDDPFQL